MTPLDEVMRDKANTNKRNAQNYSGIPDINYEGFTEYEGRNESTNGEWTYDEES